MGNGCCRSGGPAADPPEHKDHAEATGSLLDSAEPRASLSERTLSDERLGGGVSLEKVKVSVASSGKGTADVVRPPQVNRTGSQHRVGLDTPVADGIKRSSVLLSIRQFAARASQSFHATSTSGHSLVDSDTNFTVTASGGLILSSMAPSSKRRLRPEVELGVAISTGDKQPMDDGSMDEDLRDGDEADDEEITASNDEDPDIGDFFDDMHEIADYWIDFVPELNDSQMTAFVEQLRDNLQKELLNTFRQHKEEEEYLDQSLTPAARERGVSSSDGLGASARGYFGHLMQKEKERQSSSATASASASPAVVVAATAVATAATVVGDSSPEHAQEPHGSGSHRVQDDSASPVPVPTDTKPTITSTPADSTLAAIGSTALSRKRSSARKSGSGVTVSLSLPTMSGQMCEAMRSTQQSMRHLSDSANVRKLVELLNVTFDQLMRLVLLRVEDLDLDRLQVDGSLVDVSSEERLSVSVTPLTALESRKSDSRSSERRQPPVAASTSLGFEPQLETIVSGAAIDEDTKVDDVQESTSSDVSITHGSSDELDSDRPETMRVLPEEGDSKQSRPFVVIEGPGEESREVGTGEVKEDASGGRLRIAFQSDGEDSSLCTADSFDDASDMPPKIKVRRQVSFESEASADANGQIEKTPVQYGTAHAGAMEDTVTLNYYLEELTKVQMKMATQIRKDWIAVLNTNDDLFNELAAALERTFSTFDACPSMLQNFQLTCRQSLRKVMEVIRCIVMDVPLSAVSSRMEFLYEEDELTALIVWNDYIADYLHFWEECVEPLEAKQRVDVSGQLFTALMKLVQPTPEQLSAIHKHMRVERITTSFVEALSKVLAFFKNNAHFQLIEFLKQLATFHQKGRVPVQSLSKVSDALEEVFSKTEPFKENWDESISHANTFIWSFCANVMAAQYYETHHRTQSGKRPMDASATELQLISRLSTSKSSDTGEITEDTTETPTTGHSRVSSDDESLMTMGSLIGGWGAGQSTPLMKDMDAYRGLLDVPRAGRSSAGIRPPSPLSRASTTSSISGTGGFNVRRGRGGSTSVGLSKPSTSVSTASATAPMTHSLVRSSRAHRQRRTSRKFSLSSIVDADKYALELVRGKRKLTHNELNILAKPLKTAAGFWKAHLSEASSRVHSRIGAQMVDKIGSEHKEAAMELQRLLALLKKPLDFIAMFSQFFKQVLVLVSTATGGGRHMLSVASGGTHMVSVSGGGLTALGESDVSERPKLQMSSSIPSSKPVCAPGIHTILATMEVGCSFQEKMTKTMTLPPSMGLGMGVGMGSMHRRFQSGAAGGSRHKRRHSAKFHGRSRTAAGPLLLPPSTEAVAAEFKRFMDEMRRIGGVHRTHRMPKLLFKAVTTVLIEVMRKEFADQWSERAQKSFTIAFLFAAKCMASAPPTPDASASITLMKSSLVKSASEPRE